MTELDRAVELAFRALSSRDRTVAELRAWLERKRVEPAAIDHAVDTVTSAGFLDDARFARLFTEDKRGIERWGPDRIERDLRRRGVAPHLIETALAARGHEHELAAALELLREKVAPPADDRERDRAWRLLVRKGYGPDLAYEAVRVHQAGLAA